MKSTDSFILATFAHQTLSGIQRCTRHESLSSDTQKYSQYNIVSAVAEDQTMCSWNLDVGAIKAARVFLEISQEKTWDLEIKR